MANVKVKGLSDNFFIKLCSLRRNKTWYKMRKLTKFSCNETGNLEGEHEKGGWGSGSSLFLACTHLGMPFQLPKQSSGNRI